MGTAKIGGFNETREQIHRQMLSTVSHDLKTPLATMIGSLEVYKRMDEKLSKEKKDALINSALTEAYRLDNFITNILDMAKLEGGLIKAKPEPSNLTSLLQDSLIRLGPKRDKGNVSLRAHGINLVVHTDPMLLGRAAGFLLENALKHAGKSPVITVEYGIDKDGAFIKVRDNGAGIPQGQEQAIFSKYISLSKSDQQNAGTGLGLALCRGIMKILRGDVTGYNHEQGGAEFLLKFPQKLSQV